MITSLLYDFARTSMRLSLYGSVASGAFCGAGSLLCKMLTDWTYLGTCIKAGLGWRACVTHLCNKRV